MDSDFELLKCLVESARNNPKNVGHYILRSYLFAKGIITLDECLEPIQKEDSNSLTLVFQ